ncbi:ABC transporter permease [Actinomadura sp. CNU-125]|uniref:ABC transporter permease n=1 Tax=Actinomadura sp. CNU-125 TaxID=1904961 RepID=UPI000A77AADD
MSTYASFRSLSRAMLLGFVRDRGALAFTILFPLMFLVIFAGIFGNQTTSKVEVLRVGPVPIVERAVAAAPDELGEVMELTAASDRAQALRDVEKGDVSAVVEQRGHELIVHYSAADQVRSGTVRSLMNQIVQSSNVAATGKAPTYSMSAQQVEDDSLNAIQFFTPSLLGWALASAGVFGASQTLVSWRTKGILRRLQLSPAPIPTVFAARVAVSLASRSSSSPCSWRWRRSRCSACG